MSDAWTEREERKHVVAEALNLVRSCEDLDAGDVLGIAEYLRSGRVPELQVNVEPVVPNMALLRELRRVSDDDSEYAARGVIATERGARLRAERDREELRFGLRTCQHDRDELQQKLDELLAAAKAVFAEPFGPTQATSALREVVERIEKD